MTTTPTHQEAVHVLRDALRGVLRVADRQTDEFDAARDALAATSQVEAATEPVEIILQAHLKGDGFVEVNPEQYARYQAAGTAVRKLHCYLAPQPKVEAATSEAVAWLLEDQGCRAPDDCEEFERVVLAKDISPDELARFVKAGRAHALYAAPLALPATETAPKFDDAEFNAMVEKGTKAWAEVPQNWPDELRGNAQAAQAKPDLSGLTDTEIDTLMASGLPNTRPSAGFRQFARAVEGIVRARMFGPDQQAILVPHATLQLIDAAMQHMGDQLNEMDVVEEEDEAICTPAFEAVAAILAHPVAQAKPEGDGWISVEDRLPPIDMEAPEYTRYVNVLTASDAGVSEMRFISQAYAKTERGRIPRFEWMGKVSPWEVTHWRNLPAPPATTKPERGNHG